MATSMFTSASILSCYVYLSFLLFCSDITEGKPERGKWIDNADKSRNILWYVKSVYNNSQIAVGVTCLGDSDVKLNINWVLRRSPCAQEYMGLNETYASIYLRGPSNISPVYQETEYMKHTIEKVTCTKGRQFFFHTFSEDPQIASYIQTKEVSATEAKVAQAKDIKKADDNTKKTESRKKREAENEAPEAVKAPEVKATEVAVKQPNPDVSDAKARADIAPESVSYLEAERFVRVWKDGYYVLILEFTNAADDANEQLPEDFKAEVTVKMSWGKDNYISAGDYPLLIFYGVMGLVYIGLGLFWLFLLACNWQDLLRVQFWIGGVIFLGMLEKAVFFAEYENINKDGEPVRGLILLAELVSCIKRGLARMLVIIVCLGFGIIKPRLGQTLHKVLLAGITFIVLASIEGCMRALRERPDQSTEWMFAAVPLAVTDAIICWWVFSALLQTTRTLRLRRNVVKLGLYRHLTNSLIFAIVASIAYMIWFLTQHRFKNCITDWKELWVDEAFWHLLFSVILFIIMLLWRPTANNQRYAFSPLLDAAEDDLDDDQSLSEAYEGMKMRSTKPTSRNSRSNDTDSKMEDDLKWVEENIPSSLADKLLPALDSDEEIMNQKFEVSKME